MRLFIAYKFSPDISNLIYCNVSSLDVFKSQHIISSENYHLTLKFLGETSINPDHICKELANLEGFGSFNFFLSNRIGYLPSFSNPKLAYLKIKDAENRLSDLSKAVDNLVVQFGFKPERRSFKPHLTVVRIKHLDLNPGLLPHFLTKDVKREIILDKIALFESTLHPSGAIYKEVFSISL